MKHYVLHVEPRITIAIYAWYHEPSSRAFSTAWPISALPIESFISAAGTPLLEAVQPGTYSKIQDRG
jgi:hypothetical protein